MFLGQIDNDHFFLWGQIDEPVSHGLFVSLLYQQSIAAELIEVVLLRTARRVFEIDGKETLSIFSCLADC